MGILDALGSGMQKVGNAVQSGFSGFGQQFQPPADPNAMNAQYGVPEQDVYQQRMASLQRMGALYMAAGQSMSGKDRAMILAQLGNNNPTTDFYNMAQARLMNTRVQDAERQRQQKLQALQDLQSGDGLSNVFDAKEKELFNLYLKAGDLDGALDAVSKARARNDEGVMLADGSTTSRGAYNTNRQGYQKTYQPMLDSLDQTMNIGQEILNAVDGGMFSGALGPAKQAGAKLLRAIGITDPTMVEKILNTENVQGAVMPLVLDRMKDLGGNDSNEELQIMLRSLTGEKLEPETVRSNVRRTMKTALRNAGRANEQFKRLTTKGGMGYGGDVDVTEDMVPERYRDTYLQLTGKASPPAEASGGPAIGTERNGFRFKGGNPNDKSSWEKIN